jgi:hypothetical protein
MSFLSSVVFPVPLKAAKPNTGMPMPARDWDGAEFGLERVLTI